MTASGSPRRPFQDLSAVHWQNLALAGVVLFYLAQILLDISWHNFCGRLAIDYCAFWSAGHLARTEGYEAVYDLERLERIQRLVFPSRLESLENFPVIPTPYLPPFLVPFALLEPLGPRVGYVVWSAVNLLVFFFYVQSHIRRSTGAPPERRLLIFMLAAYPVFLNLLYGQVNIWLTIFIGEYLRAAASKAPFRAGLWLGGLLIKPQYLALIGIALLMQRSWRTLIGLAAAAAALLGVSYMMLGQSGFSGLLQLWLGFAAGLPSTGPNVMMNWRTVGLFLAGHADARVVWSLLAIAMVATAAAGLSPWRRHLEASGPLFPVALLATLAATCAFIWHSHISSATILIIPLMLLYQHPRQLARNALELWVLVPPALQLVSTILAGLVKAGALKGVPTDFINFLSAVAPFAFNIYFLVWALRYLRERGSMSAA